MTPWKFDRKILEDSLKQCQTKLNNQTLSLIDRFEIEEDESFFINMLNGNYSNEQENFYYYEGIEDEYENDTEECQFEELKERILLKCIDYHNELGDSIIDLIIKLAEENVFYIPSESKDEILSIDEQEEYTIKNYETHSKKLLKPAKEILKAKKLIQVSTQDKITSYTQFPYSIDLPFIIVNPNERNSILNHELEHAIEFMLNIGREKDGYLLELGSIYFEMLFCDLFHQKTNKNYSTDYEKRVIESTIYIRDLYPIFLFIRELKRREFNINDNEFEKLCNEILEIDIRNLEEFLNEELEEKFESRLRYLLSHLKAIELRENTTNNNDSFDILFKEFNKPLQYETNSEKIMTYKRYLSEIERKR